LAFRRDRALPLATSAALDDPALKAEAQKMALDIGYMSGDELQALLAKLYALPPNVVTRARHALIYRPPN
jgi:hypothetical protein